MKSQILSIKGEKLKEIELPDIFSGKIREDIVKKAFESEKIWQPYGPDKEAGKKSSAAGVVRHLRHVWKSGYGHGKSRVPRKIMWRRGSQFYWVGAEISGARGGRRAHPPKPESMVKTAKINKKEMKIAFESAIAGTADSTAVKSRYEKLKNVKIENVPIIVESRITELKTNELKKALERILGNLYIAAEKIKRIRCGKGKSRNRKYKTSRGVLLIIGNKENIKTMAVDNRRVGELSITDLYPLGRLVVYTEKAIADLRHEGGKENDN
ncbi:MAG: 50S ribosomal protein L4 [Candidatus Pacearchaeota archaeon]